MDQSLVESKAKNPYVRSFEFTPNFQGESDAELLERLAEYRRPFVAPVADLGSMLESLKKCMSEDAEEME